MRNLYEILGVPRTATEQEIKTAYRKLSLKFHPDKNDGDAFFEERFKEVNEAYTVLGDTAKRRLYDNPAFIKQPRPTPPRPPIHAHFRCSKDQARQDDILIFDWCVDNATHVEISPFGVVEPTGSRKIRLLGFKEKPFVAFKLTAFNDLTNQRVEKEIRVFEMPIWYKRVYQWIRKKGLISNSAFGWYSVALLFGTFYFAFNNGEKAKNKPVQTPTANVAKRPKDTIKPIPVPSQWTGNRLKNGDSPFNTCFGPGQRRGQSWILFKNGDDVDAIVCLIDVTTNRTIRNEYASAGRNFKMTRIPVGSYYLKAVYGRDWNPNMSSPCGSNGFFETVTGYTVSDSADSIITITSNELSYSTYTITLYPVSNGNMGQRDIDASQFFN